MARTSHCGKSCPRSHIGYCPASLEFRSLFVLCCIILWSKCRAFKRIKMTKYILPFSSTEATLALVGGKGANLAELARAGFAVPPGFIVTTDTYRTFVAVNKIQTRILSLAKNISPDDPTTLEN